LGELTRRGFFGFVGATVPVLLQQETVLTREQCAALKADEKTDPQAITVNIDARGALLGDFASQQKFKQMVEEALIKSVEQRRRVARVVQRDL
jgi:hypothetical protein